MKKQEIKRLKSARSFFWDVIVPRCYPDIEYYFNDLVKHDRESFKWACQDKAKVLLRVGTTGTHIISSAWFTKPGIHRMGESDDGMMYSYDFIENGWRYNFGYKTTALYLVDCENQTMTKITWEDCTRIFREWAWRVRTAA